MIVKIMVNLKPPSVQLILLFLIANFLLLADINSRVIINVIDRILDVTILSLHLIINIIQKIIIICTMDQKVWNVFNDDQIIFYRYNYVCT